MSRLRPRDDRPLPIERVGRAHGKVILLGEHAVVYGAAALAAGIDRGVQAVVQPAAHPERAELQLLGRTVVAEPTASDLLARAWAALLAVSPATSCDAQVRGDLPAGVGLGFSAAVGTALGRALAQLLAPCSDERDPDEAGSVCDRAMAWERVFHGNPSGVDVAAARTGGLIRFSKAAGVRRVPVSTALSLCVGLSGSRGSTSRMVAQVAALRARNPVRVDELVAAIDGEVGIAERAMVAGDVPALGRCLDDCHGQLQRLGVSTSELDRLCQLARSAGALGAKLTGSGGGGAVIALAGGLDRAGVMGPAVQATVDRVLSTWREAGFEAFPAIVGAPPPRSLRTGAPS